MGNMTTLQILQGVHDWVLDKIDEETANFITKTVNDLVNYYTKSETYTKAEVQQIVDAIKQFTYEVVQVLPTASASTMNKIYLVPAPKSEDKNVKEEYITIQDGSTYSWEMLGTTSIDLSNYYTKGQTDSAISSALSSALASYTTTADLTTLLAQKQDVIQDLADIRSGASAGSTAVQPSTLNNAVKNVVAESGVYDVSANNDNTKFESLSALLSSANLNTLIPTDIRKGGMSIKFVLSSDNKYIQFRYMGTAVTGTPNPFLDTANWQGVDDEPTAGSDNLVKSGGVDKYLAHKETIVSNPEYTQGARKINGTIDTSATTYGYTGSIELKNGETIFLNLGNAMYHGGDVVELSELDGNGTWVRGLIQGSNYQTKKEQYTNTSGSTIYVSISGYKIQLGYIIKNIAEAATKEDVDSLFSRTDILSEGVDSAPTLNSEKLVKSGGVYNALGSKIDYNVVDGVTNPYTTINTKYIRYSDGAAVTSYAAAGFTIYLFKTDYIKHLRCYLGSDGNTPAAIAFYSSDTIDTTSSTIGTYMKNVSVEASNGKNWYETDIPDGAKWVAVTNRGAELASPQIIITSIPFEKVGSIDTYNRKKIYERNEAAVSSAIFYAIDIRNLPVGTQLEVDVKDYTGITPPRILLRGNDNIYKTDIIVPSVGKYYIEVDGKANAVLFRKEATENNIFNFTVSSVKEYLVCNRVQPNYTPSVGSFNIGTLFQGYYNNNSSDPENNVVLSSSWVSYPLQKSNGHVIHISCSDWTSYYVVINFWNTALNKYTDYNITSDSDVSIECCGAWNVTFRRKNYDALTPSDAANIVIVTRSVNGYLFERPLTQKDGAKFNSDISVVAERATKGAVIAKEGYGFNPFVGKPFYYHFAANSFLKVIEALDEDPWVVYRNAIASQSLDDVEIASRLGFSIIEANVHKTSDNNYIVIHGNAGAFGLECMSVDEEVITTSELQSTAIDTKTLAWVKDNVRYNSYYEKYQTTIPSLEEFCEACKIHNIGIFTDAPDKKSIDICVKYLGQNVFIYNPPSNIRDYFNGWVFIWNNTTTTTVDRILTVCKEKGAPVMYGIGPDLAAKLYTDNNLDTLIEAMHQEGFLIGWTANYDTEENGRKYLKMGMDFSSSGHDVNPFVANYEVFDIDSDNLPTTTGSVSEGMISLTNGQTITCGNTAKIIGKGWLSVRFNGTLTFTFGSCGNTGRTITSDGSEDIVITDYFFRRGSILTVIASADTTVTKFLYKTSKC